MLESDPTDTTDTPASTGENASEAPASRKRAPRKVAKKAAVPTPDPAEVASAGAEVGPSSPSDESAAGPVKATRKRAPRKATAPSTDPTPAASPAAPAAETVAVPADDAAPAPAKKATRRRATKAAAAPESANTAEPAVDAAAPVADGAALVPDAAAGSAAAVFEAPAPATKTARKRVSKKAAAAAAQEAAAAAPAESAPSDGTPTEAAPAAMTAPSVLFIAPQEEPAPRRRRGATKAAGAPAASSSAPVEPAAGDAEITVAEEPEDETADPDDVREAAIEQASGARRRRRRGRRGRGGAARNDDDSTDDNTDDSTDDGDDSDGGAASGNASESGDDDSESSTAGDESGDESGSSSRRRRRRRRSAGGGEDDSNTDDPPNTVTHVRERAPRGGGNNGGGNNGGGNNADDDGVKGVKGSTRLEAKRQRRRDGRDTTRRRAPILSEAEFLARREAVNRVMAVRQNGDRTQIAVLEDDVLVEHYVTRASSTSYVGNVYLGRVQNVLPSMEAAFIDIGKGRNGVLYAGEVNWDAAGLDGKSRTIEHAMKSGDAVLVQVTKDPIGHKGARLTSQVSLPGRFLVYVPGGGMTGISRRLPDTERHRLKAILKKIVPDEAGVIVRTAAEGASEEDLTHDVERLQAQWEAIQKKSGQTKAAPTLVHGEPDLAIRVVRDVFNEDFASLVVQGDDAWSTISEYLGDIAPDLAARASRHVKDTDLFHDLRVDEQLMKALDRKVWLPSGGSLVIDRTEAMTVIDVNTGKFVGSGGNLEQTVTRNNLEAAEEVVRQLRLRDVGGIVVIDFIDMVLESNRDLVLRRLTECLGRDRTKHQVAEVTSLGLVQMTRKRVGEGLLEAFSERCEHCGGRGLITHTEPVDQNGGGSTTSSGGDSDDDRPKSKRRRGGRGSTPEPVETPEEPAATDEQRRAASAAIAAIHRAAALEKAEAAAALEADESGIVDRLANGLVAAAMTAENEGSADGAGTVNAEATQAMAEATPESTSESTPEPTPDAEPTPESQPTTEAQPTPEPDPTQQVVEAVQAVEHVAPAAPDSAANGAAPAPAGRRRRRAASRPAGPPVATT